VSRCRRVTKKATPAGQVSDFDNCTEAARLSIPEPIEEMREMGSKTSIPDFIIRLKTGESGFEVYDQCFFVFPVFPWQRPGDFLGRFVVVRSGRSIIK